MVTFHSYVKLPEGISGYQSPFIAKFYLQTGSPKLTTIDPAYQARKIKHGEDTGGGPPIQPQ
jgi:hypothetical protein